MAELEDDIEGTDFEAIFGRIAKTTGKTYANREDRDKRWRSERRAGLTAKQRERVTVPKNRGIITIGLLRSIPRAISSAAFSAVMTKGLGPDSRCIIGVEIYPGQITHTPTPCGSSRSRNDKP